ncbi:endophilin-A3-like isoform X2 [Clavelina lepadiformis]|uniref:endophilin-A3-like isoform X2 n=1 Tax=Clavelina lepadiformis TaxID=159417 RepID=UPI0040435CDF
MSFGGIKKQWNKANQYVSEKMGNENDKTRMEDEFIEMERKVDITNKAITELMSLTKEYLQPNPTTRAKLSMMNTYQKIQGKHKDMRYPQAEGNLADCMTKYGSELGIDSNFGNALKEVGEAMTQLSEIKDSLDVGVKQNFLDPLQQLCDKDIKEVMHHRKKLSGRRLDYDYKRKKGHKLSPGELQLAEEKLQEALDLADNSLFNLISADVEQVAQMDTLVETQLEYHRQSTDILESLHESLQKLISEIHRQPEKERTRRQIRSNSMTPMDRSPISPPTASPQHPAPSSPAKPGEPSQPCCKGLYDFEPENEGELAFGEGDIITLVSRIDENWYEGMNSKGETGYFPVSYVDVILDLPN